jgi:hypothetical protein
MATTKYIVDNKTGQTIESWTFGENALTFPDNSIQTTAYPGTPSFISSGPSAPGSAVVANPTNVNINFSDGIGTAWSFGTTGMSFPDDSIQTTAYTGGAYKAYMFKLDRSTGVPIALQDYENTIGPMSLTNGPSGTVKATLAGAFPTNKVIIFTQGVPSSPVFSSTVNDINFNGSTNNFIEIRVYN